MNVFAFLRYAVSLAAATILAACSGIGSAPAPSTGGAQALPQSVAPGQTLNSLYRRFGAPASGHTPAQPNVAKERVLHAFQAGTDGAFPSGGLLPENGSFYGTTEGGGSENSYCGAKYAGGCGTVFRLTRKGKRYAESIIYAFTGAPDGYYPYDVKLISDSTGALYGTTDGGGAQGLGTVFRLKREGKRYTESVLYSFTPGDGGGGAAFGVIADAAGNLYGTTSGGGSSSSGYGAVYELKRSGSSYTEKILYSFQSNGSDGIQPECALLMDRKGALFGTTTAGGTYGDGTVFKLTPSGSTYKEAVLYSFGATPSDGQLPDAGLIADRKGTFYGVTEIGGPGGPSGYGTVYRLSGSGNKYTESVLYSFGSDPDGAYPSAPLTLEGDKLYGTTQQGGVNRGIVFRLTLAGAEKILYTFTGGNDGGLPVSQPLLYRGRLLGTTIGGGGAVCGDDGLGCGTAFELLHI